ncbi:MAG: QueT transporter family protein [Anaerovoracaceae bacterium]
MKTKHLIQAAVIAAIYAVLTIVLAPLSYGPMQIRISEALTILPFFTPAAIPGLFIGCFISNVLGPYGIIDMVCGSLATLIAAFFSYKLAKRPILVPLPPVILNGVIIGGMLYYAYGVPMNLFVCMGWVALGQAAACYIVGYPLMKLLSKYKGIF